MGMVMGVTAVVLTVAAGLVGLMVWTALMFPQLTARSEAAVEQRPARCLLIGIGMLLLIGLPARALLQLPNGMAKLCGWALSLLLVALLIAGMAGMARLLGERLRALSPALTPLGGFVRGAITLELAAIVPLLGWFLFAPLVGLTLTGAGMLACLGRRKQHHTPPEPGPDGGGSAPDTDSHGDRQPALALLALALPACLPALGLLTAATLR